MPRVSRLVSIALLVAIQFGTAAGEPRVVYEGFDGPGKGKHIVLVSGDEEYRSEEALPQLGKILAKHHGFKCTVLFAIDKTDGVTINPDQTDNIPGLEALKTADLMVIFTRFRNLLDEQMKYVDEYLQSGRPVLGIRTATHAFHFKEESESSFRHYDFQSTSWEGGFGRQVLGETWISHHGHHKVQSTRAVIVPQMKEHPILRGVKDIWVPTDVYTARLPLPESCKPLLLGQVLTGMDPSDKPVVGEYVQTGRGGEVRTRPNDPMMPVAWTKTFETKSGKRARVFTTTMGSSVDLVNEGLRRLLVNAAYWCLRWEDRIPADGSSVDLVGDYDPTFYGFGEFQKGVKPSEHVME